MAGAAVLPDFAHPVWASAGVVAGGGTEAAVAVAGVVAGGDTKAPVAVAGKVAVAARLAGVVGAAVG